MVQIIDDEVTSTVDYEDLVQTIAIGFEDYVQSCDIYMPSTKSNRNGFATTPPCKCISFARLPAPRPSSIQLLLFHAPQRETHHRVKARTHAGCLPR